MHSSGVFNCIWLVPVFLLSFPPHPSGWWEAFQRLVLTNSTHYFKELIISPYYSVFHCPDALTISSLFPQFSHLHFKHKVFVLVSFAITYMLFYYVLASSYNLTSFPPWVSRLSMNVHQNTSLWRIWHLPLHFLAFEKCLISYNIKDSRAMVNRLHWHRGYKSFSNMVATSHTCL